MTDLKLQGCHISVGSKFPDNFLTYHYFNTIFCLLGDSTHWLLSKDGLSTDLYFLTLTYSDSISSDSLAMDVAETSDLHALKYI